MDLEQYRMKDSIVLASHETLVFSRIKDVKLINRISERINVWTNGQPFLNCLIYQYLNQYSEQIVSAEGAAIVDEIVSQKIIKNWQQNKAATHLGEIEHVLLTHRCRDELLILYMRVLWLDETTLACQLPVQARTDLQRQVEQSPLLRVGLLEERAGQLRVANAIYAAIFDRAWIESQISGLTRPVAMTPLSSLGPSLADSSEMTSEMTAVLRFYRSLNLKILAGLGGLLLSLLTLAHAQAIPFILPVQTTVSYKPTAPERHAAQAPSSESISPSDQLLFEQGVNHATNARWLPMLRKFCRIPAGSLYFAPAKQRLTQWVEIYSAEIQQANRSLKAIKKDPCELAENVLIASADAID
ncbi:MAG: hypothetical protein AAFQ63_14690 [Cyanobacteria bacterium J06621_11]